MTEIVEFGIEVERLGATHVVEIRGDADLYTAPKLREALASSIEAGAATLVVDLTRATFIDSTTLGALIGALKRLRERDGEIRLVITDRSVRKVFEITLLDRVFPIHERRDDALGDLSVSS